MPIYEFECLGCNNEFEKLLPVDQRDDFIECPTCGTQSKRVMRTAPTCIAKWAGRTSPKALGSAEDFLPRSKKEWHQAVGRNHGRG